MKVEASISIEGNKKKVWGVITKVGDFAKIIKGVENILVVERPASGLVGLKWRETRMLFGEPASVDKWITEAVVESFYETRAEMDGFVFITTMTIRENGGLVELISCHETKAQSFAARIKSLPMVFFRGVLKKAIVQDLVDFKRAVEGK